MARTPSPAATKTAEEQRLDETREEGVPWKQWGAIPQRAPMGHGARGLQR